MGAVKTPGQRVKGKRSELKKTEYQSMDLAKKSVRESILSIHFQFGHKLNFFFYQVFPSVADIFLEVPLIAADGHW